MWGEREVITILVVEKYSGKIVQKAVTMGRQHSGIIGIWIIVYFNHQCFARKNEMGGDFKDFFNFPARIWGSGSRFDLRMFFARVVTTTWSSVNCLGRGGFSVFENPTWKDDLDRGGKIRDTSIMGNFLGYCVRFHIPHIIPPPQFWKIHEKMVLWSIPNV